MTDEKALIIKAQESGNINQAMRYLMKTYSSVGAKLAYEKVGNYDMAADIVQECFINIANTFHKINPNKKFFTYFYRIVSNRIIDYIRKKHNKIKKNDILEMPELKDSLPSQQEVQEGKGLEALIEEVINDLPEKQSYIMRRYIEGYCVNDIAEFLEIPKETARRNLHVARKKIKKVLKKAA